MVDRAKYRFAGAAKVDRGRVIGAVVGLDIERATAVSGGGSDVGFVSLLVGYSK